MVRKSVELEGHDVLGATNLVVNGIVTPFNASLGLRGDAAAILVIHRWGENPAHEGVLEEGRRRDALQIGRPPESLTALGVHRGDALAEFVASAFALAVSSTVLRNLECLMECTLTLEKIDESRKCSHSVEATLTLVLVGDGVGSGVDEIDVEPEKPLGLPYSGALRDGDAIARFPCAGSRSGSCSAPRAARGLRNSSWITSELEASGSDLKARLCAGDELPTMSPWDQLSDSRRLPSISNAMVSGSVSVPLEGPRIQVIRRGVGDTGYVPNLRNHSTILPS